MMWRGGTGGRGAHQERHEWFDKRKVVCDVIMAGEQRMWYTLKRDTLRSGLLKAYAYALSGLSHEVDGYLVYLTAVVPMGGAVKINVYYTTISKYTEFV